jgi:hypothetical protein
MSTSPISNQHPEYGFNPTTPVTATLTQASLSGTSFQRIAGLYEAMVYVSCSAFAGGGSVNVLLEGSNDNANWEVISGLSPLEYITAAAQVRTLGGGSDQVPLYRWAYLRVRAVVASGGPTFTLSYTFAGIAGDSEKFIWTGAVTLASGTGTAFLRPAGTKYYQVQLVATDVVLGGGTNTTQLQGSADGGTTWVNLASYSITGNGAVLMLSNDGGTLIDVGPYARLRMVTAVAGGAPTSITVTYYVTADSLDWIFLPLAPSSGGVTPSLSDALLTVDLDTPSAEVLDVITVGLQVLDGNGDPCRRAVLLQAIVYDTSNAGTTDLATNATITAIAGGAIVSGTGTNRVSFTTSALGAATLSITDVAVETVYFCVTQLEGPLSTYQIVWKSEQAALVFA